MKVWVVSESDEYYESIKAVYSTQALAELHVAAIGGHIEECEIRWQVHPDCVDTQVLKQIADKQEQNRQSYITRQRHEEERSRSIAAMRPNPPHMRLCHCRTFSNDFSFITEHGYCGYCGGWEPQVFRQHMGEWRLRHAIDELDIHDRLKMRKIVGIKSSGAE